MKQKLYYWEITFSNGTIEYWQSKEPTYHFEKMDVKMNDGSNLCILQAKQLTKIVYLWHKKRKQPCFTITLE